MGVGMTPEKTDAASSGVLSLLRDVEGSLMVFVDDNEISGL